MPGELSLVRLSLPLFALTLSACVTPSAGIVQPRPTINLGVSHQRLAMELPPGTRDELDLLRNDLTNDDSPIPVVHVTGFRTSLTNGFVASFRSYYTLVSAGDNADLTLRFQTVSIEVDPDCRLILHFAVQLDDRGGRTLGRSFGTLPPTHRIGEVGEDVALSEALTKLFERVAMDCFVPLSIAH